MMTRGWMSTLTRLRPRLLVHQDISSSLCSLSTPSSRKEKRKAKKSAAAAVVSDEEDASDGEDKPKAKKGKGSSKKGKSKESVSETEKEKDQQRRQESGRARSGVVGEVWVEVLPGLVGVENTVQQRINSCASSFDLQDLQGFVADQCLAHHHKPILSSSPVWPLIPPRTLALFAAVICDPSGFDEQPFIDDGTLVLSDDQSEAPVGVCAKYMRLISVPGDTIISALYRYLAQYPADAPKTVLQLLAHGESLSSIAKHFEEGMSVYGLEEAVQIFIQAAELSSTVLHFAEASSRPTKKTKLTYSGLTAAVAPGQRVQDDLAAKSQVRVINFINSFPTPPKITTFHIPSLDTPIADRLDVRTNPVISEKERILIYVGRFGSMNSAPGGTQPLFVPTPALQSLRNIISSMDPGIPFPLGEERSERLERELERLLDDELRIVAPTSSVQIAPSAFRAVKDILGGVVRLSNGRVVTVEVAKDITQEGILGKVGGYWSETVGRGPQEDRHLRRQYHPEIPATGDLSLSVIAKYIGPYTDFWRLTLWHWWYWIEVILLSRLLLLLNPWVITTQSNPVAAILQSGDLPASWSFLDDAPASEASFIAAETPANFPDLFPLNTPYRQFKGGEFNAVQGKISLVRTGRKAHNVALHVSKGHAGRLKYDTMLAFFRWLVDFLVHLVIQVLLQIVSVFIQQNPDFDSDDGVQMRTALKGIRDQALDRLAESGVTEALERAKISARKHEFVNNFLRAIASSKRAEDGWYGYQRRDGVKTAVGTEARIAQAEAILASARELFELDLPCDLNGFGNWKHPLLSSTWIGWFLGLKDNIEIVYASNQMGRSEEAHLSVIARHEAFAEWRRSTPKFTHSQHIGFIRANLIKSVKDLVAGVGAPYLCGGLEDAYRYFKCGTCNFEGIARNNGTKHACPQQELRDGRRISAKAFPTVERALYAHDILTNSFMVGILGEIADVLAELNLVAVPATEILGSPARIQKLRAVLCSIDFEALMARIPLVKGDVFIRPEQLRNDDLLLTLAVDQLLLTTTTFPNRFLPTDSATRSSYKQVEGEKLVEWFQSDRKTDLFAIFCPGPPGTPLPHFALSDKTTERDDPKKTGDDHGTGNKFYVIKPGGLKCKPCNTAVCAPRRFEKITSLIHLPPHHARFLWLHLRRGLTIPETRLTKQSKARREKTVQM
ncbi:hypothetical protein B0H13DRAFT_740328 [Mycena leptocephala]|nr:hypothetical protein B0H13DRAFT_740328 [Mycena leptocephala]